MHTKCPNKFAKLVAIILIITVLTPTAVQADTLTGSPRASIYLDSYNTYIYNAAWGKIQIYFDVTGVDYMDDIGTLTIQLYESTDNENWTRVTTYRHESTSGMLGNNKIYHSGHVDYSGTIGRYYKAYVCFWAGKDGAGDTRYYWTQTQKATLFAG